MNIKIKYANYINVIVNVHSFNIDDIDYHLIVLYCYQSFRQMILINKIRKSNAGAAVLGSFGYINLILIWNRIIGTNVRTKGFQENCWTIFDCR